jgi:hypothetical protein
MKSADVRRRVDAVSESLKTLRIKGTTKIDWNCLTSEEQALFDKVYKLKAEYSPYSPPDDVLAANHGLFLKGMEFILRRALDLFQEAAKAYCCVAKGDEVFFEFIFNVRIFWFLHELGRQCEKSRNEMELVEKYETDEELGRAYDEYLETVEDKTRLWSPESFERFTKPFFDSRLNKRGKQK